MHEYKNHGKFKKIVHSHINYKKKKKKGQISISIIEAILEGDAELIIKALQEKEAEHPVYGHILEGTVVLFLGFYLVSFFYVKRLGDLVAHYLAKQAKFGEEI